MWQYKIMTGKTTKKKIIFAFCIMLLLAVLLTACKDNTKNEDSSVFSVYYLSGARDGLDSKEYSIDSMQDEDIVNRLITLMEFQSVNANLRTENVALNGNTLVVDFNQEFTQLSDSDRALIEMAVVKTLTQVPVVEMVSFTVGGVPVKDNKGNVKNPVSGDDYINSEDGMALESSASVYTLFYAAKSGEMLETVEREIISPGAAMPESIIIKALINGPEKGEKVKAVINKNTVVNSVQKTDDTVYVDLSDEFLKLPKGVTSDMAVYSIVNTLTKGWNVTSVVITVNSDPDAGFLSSYDNKLYTNYGIIK